jgi:hypothetical protein
MRTFLFVGRELRRTTRSAFDSWLLWRPSDGAVLTHYDDIQGGDR